MHPIRSLFSCMLLGPAFAQGPCHDLLALPMVQQDVLATFPLSGSNCLRVDQRGLPVHVQAVGQFTLQTVVPIASATKTLSAAVLMALVDDGVLTLDDPVGQWLPEWNVGAKAAISLRMCFTHTSGMVESHPLISDDTVTLRQAAQQLANVPLAFVPGTGFAYGGVSMHVAGAVCEVASGLAWAALFQQRIAGPLGMQATDYAAFGATPNPRIAGGAQSNLGDFAAFVDMLRNGGSRNGVSVLSPAAVDLMLTDQTSWLPILATPHPDAAPYGIGMWLERRDATGATTLAHAAGAFGFIGWVDRAHDASGVFVVRSSNQLTFPFVQRVWQACDDALLPAGVTCLGAPSPVCAGGGWVNGSTAARTGTADFALLAAQAPPDSIAALLLGDPLPAGVPVVDLVAYLGPAAVFATALASADGRARVPASLVGIAPGTVVAAQFAWLAADPCAVFGLQASHAVRVLVLP